MLHEEMVDLLRALDAEQQKHQGPFSAVVCMHICMHASKLSSKSNKGPSHRWRAYICAYVYMQDTWLSHAYDSSRLCELMRIRIRSAPPLKRSPQPSPQPPI